MNLGCFMKKILILGTFLLLRLVLHAQNDYFLFIQSENNQPYYVQSEGRTLSSSPTGHLIMSGLKDSIYIFTIGFPKSQFPEQLFQLRVNRKDAGYQLKNVVGEGWLLYNLQTLQVTKAQQVELKKQTISYGDLKKTDNFSTLMAGLVNDSAVLYTSIAKVEAVREDAKTIVPDIPANNIDVSKQEGAISPDSALAKLKTSEEQKTQRVNDTMAAKPEVVKAEVVQKNDSLPGRTVQKVEDPIKQDTALLVKNEPISRPSPPKKDTSVTKDTVAKSEIAKIETTPKTDTPVVAPVTTTTLPPVVESKPILDSVSRSQPSQPDIKPTELKPLIVWFSETKTNNGTELVFFDMSAPDRIDTIRVLIPVEPAANDPKTQSADTLRGTREEQKSATGKLIGKFFGKKNNTQENKNERNRNRAPEKESTITVTTVEKTKPVDSATSRRNSGEPVVAESKEPKQQETSNQKDNSGKFFSKLFGKKNNSESSKGDSVAKHGPVESTVKVSTIDDKKSLDTTTLAQAKKTEGTSADVEKLRKDQENADKTSTERFFGKVFGKKKKEADKDSVALREAKMNQASIKVTDVSTPTREDTVRTAAMEKKVVMVNSDCRAFANDVDIDKLKIKMLSKKDIDAQISEAKKFFKSRCLSTKQIKALSMLYQTDAEKYKLFDASYPFVSDSNNFMDLVVLLNEPYYINRFIAMVRM